MGEIKCEFGDFVACDQLSCNKPAKYTYRCEAEDGRVYHFCKKHYGDVVDDEEYE